MLSSTENSSSEVEYTHLITIPNSDMNALTEATSSYLTPLCKTFSYLSYTHKYPGAAIMHNLGCSLTPEDILALKLTFPDIIIEPKYWFD